MNNFLIDGFNLAFRAHFAFKDLTTSKGVHSGGFYGFLTTLKSLKTKRLDCKFYVAWDNASQRKKVAFPEYKANRPEFQIGPLIQDLKEALKNINVTQIECIGEEADDVMSTFVDKSETLTYIYSSDKDLLQMVKDGKAVLIRPKVGKTAERIYDEEAVKSEFGVTPEDFATYLSLKGDSVDNIPGTTVPSKLIAALVSKYHTVEGILRDLGEEKLTDFQRRNIQSSEQQLLVNFELTKLRTDLDCEYLKGSSNSFGLQLLLDKYEIKAISAVDYVDLFEKETVFLARRGPAFKTTSLFEGDDE
jgi:DNA polymerase-1